MFLDFPDFAAKCLQLLKEATPSLSGIGVLWDPTTGSLQLAAVQAAARGMGIDIKVFEARRAADIADAFHALDLAHIQGVLVLSSPLFGGNPQLVAGIAARKKVPTISLLPDIAREGGLLAYGPDIQGVYRQAGGMVRKVLQGTNPAEMPAERPTRFELIANLKTAKALGLEIPKLAECCLEVVLAVPTIPAVTPCRISAANTMGKLGRNASINAAAPIATIPDAASPRFQRTASASAPPGIWVRTPASPPTVSARPTFCFDHPRSAK